jgi:hypothetical protein
MKLFAKIHLINILGLEWQHFWIVNLRRITKNSVII